MSNKKKNFITSKHLGIERNDLFIKYFPDEVFVEYASFVTGDDIASKEHSILREEDKVRLSVVLSRINDKNTVTSDFIFTNNYMSYSSGFNGTSRHGGDKVTNWIPDYLEQAHKAPETDEPEMLDD